MSGEFEIMEVKNDRPEVDTSRGQKLLIHLVLLFLVNVLWAMATELTKHLFTVEGYDKPFLTSYIRCSSLAVHLLVAAWLRRPWRDKPHPHTEPVAASEDYTIIDPVAEDDNFYTDTVNLSLSDATFVPLRSSSGGPDTSGTESEHEQHQKRSVRFSRVAEVRALSGPGMACRLAAAARLSWPASRRAAAAAQRRRATYALRKVAGQAAKAAPLYVAAQCAWSWWIHAGANDPSQSTCPWPWLGAAGLTIGVSLSATIARIMIALKASSAPQQANISEQTIAAAGIITQIAALMIVAVTAFCLLVWSGFGACLNSRLALAMSACACAGGVFHTLFVCVPRVQAHPASHPHARSYTPVNTHLFLGGVGVVSLLCWWWVVGVAALTGVEPPLPPSRRQLLLLLLDALLGNVLLDTLILRVCGVSAAVCMFGSLPLLLLSHWLLALLQLAGPVHTAEIIAGVICCVVLVSVVLLLLLSSGRDPVRVTLVKAKRFLVRTRPLRLAVSDVEQSESLIEATSSSPDDDHEA